MQWRPIYVALAQRIADRVDQLQEECDDAGFPATRPPANRNLFSCSDRYVQLA